MDAFWLDLKFGARSLAKARGFTTVATLTLALGIGTSTAAFSVFNAVVLEPLPFTAPDRLMWLSESAKGGQMISIAWPDYLDWRDRLTTVSDVAAVYRTAANLSGDEQPEHLNSRQVTWTFFRTLGVAPAIGRTFTEDEDRVGAPRVVILGDGLWRRHFNADPAVLGRTIVLDNEPRQIIGVMPRLKYNAVTEDDVFSPLGQEATMHSGLLDRGNHRGISGIARLRDGVDESALRRELEGIGKSLEQAYPATTTGVTPTVVPLTTRLVGDVAATIRLLFAAVSLLLLLATVNVANLLVARGVSRRQELSIRAALGCGRLRLARQLLVENGLLALVGGLGGVFVATSLLRLFVATAPEDVPRLVDVGMSASVWLFAAAVSAGAALLLSVLPAIQSAHVRQQQELVRAGRGDGATPGARRVRRAFTVAEVAIAILLVAGAGLMVRTMQALASVDPGFDPSNLLTMRLQIDDSTPEARESFNRRVLAFDDALLTRVRTLPGVQHAALTLSLPIEGSQWGSIFIVGDQPVPERAKLPTSAFVPVSAGYFETMKMRLVEGRTFGADDTPRSARTAVVDRTFARHFWPRESALGKRLKQGWPESRTPWLEIVGVIDDVKLEGVEGDTPMQVYMPTTQEPLTGPALVVRSATPADELSRTVRAAVHEIDPNMPVFDVQTLDTIMRASTSRHRMTMTILTGFAGIALVLACVGLYGVVAHAVSERTREIGVRLALGATRAQVVRLFVGQGLLTTVTGMAIGIAAALALARLIRDLLFNVAPTDPVTFTITTGVLALVSLGACYLPAKRAARVDPTVALRGE
jgi:putative ABC transport system permease protein